MVCQLLSPDFLVTTTKQAFLTSIYQLRRMQSILSLEVVYGVPGLVVGDCLDDLIASRLKLRNPHAPPVAPESPTVANGERFSAWFRRETFEYG